MDFLASPFITWGVVVLVIVIGLVLLLRGGDVSAKLGDNHLEITTRPREDMRKANDITQPLKPINLSPLPELVHPDLQVPDAAHPAPSAGPVTTNPYRSQDFLAGYVSGDLRLALRFIRGPMSRHITFFVDGKSYEITAGRDGDNDVDLIDDNSISRKHAKIYTRSGFLHIVDIGSKLGISVNDDPLRPFQARQLKTGDTVLIGQSLAVVEEYKKV